MAQAEKVVEPTFFFGLFPDPDDEPKRRVHTGLTRTA